VINDITQVLLTAIAAFSAVVLVFSIHIISNIVKKVNNREAMWEQLMASLEHRIDKLEGRLLELMVQVDLISVKSITRSKSPVGEVTSTKQASPASTLDNTEKQILNALAQGPKTVTELKDLISRTREHTARLMKALFEKGLVVRDSSKKPYVYTITEEGKRKV
jgi:predicted transcriptional regulator